nr:hypothetical protein [Candidatus Sigynarchaeota archaeon]
MTTHQKTHSSIKEDLMKFLTNQPEDVTIEEIMDFLHVKQQILSGQKALQDGHYYTHEQAKELMKKWLE